MLPQVLAFVELSGSTLTPRTLLFLHHDVLLEENEDCSAAAGGTPGSSMTHTVAFHRLSEATNVKNGSASSVTPFNSVPVSKTIQRSRVWPHWHAWLATLSQVRFKLPCCDTKCPSLNHDLFCFVLCFATVAPCIHYKHYHTSARLPRLGATPAAQVSGGQIPPSTNKEKRHC